MAYEPITITPHYVPRPIVQVEEQGPAGAPGLGNSSDDFVAKALVGYPSYYKAFTYDTDGNLHRIDTWDSAAKTVLLLTRVFSYKQSDPGAPPTGMVASILYTNTRTLATLTKTFMYAGDDVGAIEVTA